MTSNHKMFTTLVTQPQLLTFHLESPKKETWTFALLGLIESKKGDFSASFEALDNFYCAQNSFSSATWFVKKLSDDDAELNQLLIIKAEFEITNFYSFKSPLRVHHSWKHKKFHAPRSSRSNNNWQEIIINNSSTILGGWLQKTHHHASSNFTPTQLLSRYHIRCCETHNTKLWEWIIKFLKSTPITWRRRRRRKVVKLVCVSLPFFWH